MALVLIAIPIKALTLVASCSRFISIKDLTLVGDISTAIAKYCLERTKSLILVPVFEREARVKYFVTFDDKVSSTNDIRNS